MHRMVLVRNVPANATEDQLREHLTKSCRGASVGAVRFLRSRAARGATGKVRCAIATLADTKQAERCIQEGTGTEMDGRQLQVYPARASPGDGAAGAREAREARGPPSKRPPASAAAPAPASTS